MLSEASKKILQCVSDNYVEGKVCQGTMARLADGTAVEPQNPAAVQRCIYGWMIWCANNAGRYDEAVQTTLETKAWHLHDSSILGDNDRIGGFRYVREVIDAMIADEFTPAD